MPVNRKYLKLQKNSGTGLSVQKGGRQIERWKEMDIESRIIRNFNKSYIKMVGIRHKNRNRQIW